MPFTKEENLKKFLSAAASTGQEPSDQLVEALAMLSGKSQKEIKVLFQKAIKEQDRKKGDKGGPVPVET